MPDVIFAVVTELPDLPELTANPVPRELKVPLAIRALMANQAQMELLVNAALPELRVPKAQPELPALKALMELRVPRVETANGFLMRKGWHSSRPVPVERCGRVCDIFLRADRRRRPAAGVLSTRDTIRRRSH